MTPALLAILLATCPADCRPAPMLAACTQDVLRCEKARDFYLAGTRRQADELAARTAEIVALRGEVDRLREEVGDPRPRATWAWGLGALGSLALVGGVVVLASDGDARVGLTLLLGGAGVGATGAVVARF